MGGANKSLFFFLFLFVSLPFYAQNSISDAQNRANFIILFDDIEDTVPAALSLKYLEQENYRKAAKLAKKMIRKSPQESGWYFVGMHSYSQMGKQKKLDKLFEDAFEDLEPSAALYYNYAIKKFKDGDIEEAEQFIQLSIQLNHKFSQAHLVLSQIHEQEGNRIQALLPLYAYFLYSELQESDVAVANLKQLLFYGIKVVQESGLSFTMPYSKQSEDDQLLKMEVMLNEIQEELSGKNLSEEQKLLVYTKGIFAYLNKNKNLKEDIWWSFYALVFGEIDENGFVEEYICNDLLTAMQETETCSRENYLTMKNYLSWKEKL